ncbi:hypothetical protein JOC85_001876 [Bacillus mesophilus]|uniref:DUF4083 domain-containing protein n=1 Tax=Bacillus mesophilus TaxID=1808955 RepID=A0A6M0Q546_9BACI|nr:DUF4083 family protein [Bacillus mesophilus]MBM7661104.1 hypothetical protein [Bacillus mesophilus]NEY71364.1 DUF4083 domain-containing protein [Bacillus mesophilus]
MEALGSLGWFLLQFILIIGLISFIFFGVGSFFSKPKFNKQNENIEQKLDRIIELLEKERKD